MEIGRSWARGPRGRFGETSAAALSIPPGATVRLRLDRGRLEPPRCSWSATKARRRRSRAEAAHPPRSDSRTVTRTRVTRWPP